MKDLHQPAGRKSGPTVPKFSSDRRHVQRPARKISTTTDRQRFGKARVGQFADPLVDRCPCEPHSSNHPTFDSFSLPPSNALIQDGRCTRHAMAVQISILGELRHPYRVYSHLHCKHLDLNLAVVAYVLHRMPLSMAWSVTALQSWSCHKIDMASRLFRSFRSHWSSE